MSRFLYPVVDGVAPAWADIAVRLTPTGGELIPMGAIQALTTGTNVELGEQREGGRVVKRTRGDVSYEASMTLYADGWQQLLRGLAAQATNDGNRLLVGLTPILINVQWTPPGSNEIFEKRLKGCRIIGESEDSAEGTDAAVIELTLSPLEIVRVIDGQEYALI